MYGAPDLALTQFMIETMTIVAFVLVLRHLPARVLGATVLGAPHPAHRARGRGGSHGRLVRRGRREVTSARPMSRDKIEQLSLPEAGGKNVVNVTIVDFRGIDTMGEITVFGIAALGVANLVAASRRATGAADARAVRQDRRRVDGLRAGDADDLPPHAARRRSTCPARAQRARRRVRRVVSSPARRSCSASWPAGAMGGRGSRGCRR